MTKPVTIPNTFATATTAIPLSQLDSDFSTVATALNDANTYSNYAADTGVANAYVVTLTGVSTTYSAGLRIQFKAGNANTGASTLNVNGGGTKNITFQDASALSSGTIAANAIVDVMYDGTQFLLMNDPAGTVGTGDVVGPASATANAIVRFDSTTGKLVKNSVVTIADSTGDMSGVGALTATGNVSFDGGTFVFNESGADKDFRIEGDTEPNLFFTDASTDRVGIGTSSPGVKLDVAGTIRSSLQFDNGGQQGATTGLVLGGVGSYYGRVIESSNNLWALGYSSTRTGAVTNAVVWDSSGNLGLGVTPGTWSDGKVIEINTAGNALWGESNYTVLLQNARYNGGYKYARTGVASSHYDLEGGSHKWYTAPSGTAGNAITFTQAMTLASNGNLGLGTTTTSYERLRVTASNTTGSSLYQYLGCTNEVDADCNILVTGTAATDKRVQIGPSTSISLCFQTGNTERARITSGGIFQVDSAVSSATALSTTNPLRIYTGTSTFTDTGAAGTRTHGTIVAFDNPAIAASNATVTYTNASTVYIDGAPTAGSNAAITNAYALYINAGNVYSGGDLLVGTAGVGGKVSVVSSSSTTPSLYLNNSASSGTANPVIQTRKFDNNTTTSNVFVRFDINDGNNGSGQINANGSNAAAFGTYSDARLKENIVDLPSQLNNICALRPVEFDYIESEGGGHQIGFVAQEIQQVYPDAVGEREDGMLTVSAWSKTEARLVKAIQEQQALITSLTARVAALEGTQP